MPTKTSNWFDDPNCLTSSEAIQSIREGNTRSEMMDQFKISRNTVNKLLIGKLKKVKIPKSSMWYEHDEEDVEIIKNE